MGDGNFRPAIESFFVVFDPLPVNISGLTPRIPRTVYRYFRALSWKTAIFDPLQNPLWWIFMVSDRSLLTFQDWLHGLPRLFTDTSEHMRFLIFSFSVFPLFRCWFRAFSALTLTQVVPDKGPLNVCVLLVPCGRLNWLVLAFACTLKRHLVSYRNVTEILQFSALITLCESIPIDLFCKKISLSIH